MACVYLLHFDEKMHHAQHYIGYADRLNERLQRHHSGNGARIVAAFRERGIRFRVARIWLGKTRTFERKLKNQKNAPRMCPICQEVVR